MPIKRLAEDVSSKIAAGEVIARPMSVVKELVENSLDAGAGRIFVELSDGGKTLIRVTDDGAGIPSAELPDAVENFSTSKIEQVTDMASVRTLGFRGEALASIRTVSRLTISSRTGAEDTGRQMRWEGKRPMADAPAVRNPGTEITVRNLFFNLPARRKFLSSGHSETRRIISLMQCYALSHPETGFTLRSGDRELFSVAPSIREQRLEAVLGPDVFARMNPFEAASERMKLTGFASLPDVTTGNRSHQYFFVNRRYIKDRLLYHAVTQAYESLVSRGRFPHVVLFLDVPPEEVDVNVHPAKAEIRFKNERAIHRLVRSTVRNAVQGEGLSFREKVESVYHGIFPDRPPRGQAVREPTLGLEGGDAAAGAGQQGLRESPVSLFDEEGATPVISSGNLYWQLHQSFIMIQIRGGMVIVDQHAAHERILYNEAKRNLQQQKPVIQSLLFPATIELTSEEFEAFEELAEELPKLGFEVEPFGMRSVIVHGIPAGARNWEEGRLLQEILGVTGSEGGGVEALLKSFACRAAVRAGAKLSPQEMESLSDQLFDTEFPFTCPHGRPTMLRVEMADLERRFERTVTT